MKLRLATFNLENLDDLPGKRPTLAERAAILRPQLLRLEADIICVQEVNGQESPGDGPRTLAALDALLDGTPYGGYASAATGGESGPYDVHNLVILSRFPIVASRQVRHELVPPPSYRMITSEPAAEAEAPVAWDRPILTAEIELAAGAILHVLNLHLRSPLAAFVPGQKSGPFRWNSVAGWAEGFFLAAMKRAGQALEARLLVERLFDADADALIAVCGDCNAEVRETATRLLAGNEEDTGNGALAGRVLVPAERSVPEDLRFTVLHNGRRAMLDHLLISRPLMAWYRHAEIHNEALGDELVAYANVSESPESYHAPIVAEFELPAG